MRVIVIGAGVGGLTAAALLAKRGFAVTVLEAHVEPGGCAATFFHKGYRFDVGATLVGGFHPGGPHQIVGEQLGITWPIRSADGLACVGIEGNEHVGFASAHDVGFLAYLSLLAVAESARGHGVGMALIRHIEQALADRGCTVLISDVWRDALGFYQSLGWSAPPVIFLRHRLLD